MEKEKENHNGQSKEDAERDVDNWRNQNDY